MDSTSVIECSLPPTTFTADSEDILPSTSELLSFAPLPDEKLSSIFSGAEKLTFESGLDHFDGYSFLIRDSLGRIQARGEVDRNSNTNLKNVNGTEMLKITKRKIENETDLNVPGNTQPFEIIHQNELIGTVKVTDNGSLRIYHRKTHPQICVLSLKIGDFAVYRSTSMSSPICNIQIPRGDVYSSEIGTITFHLETGITIEEQLLCTAAMIAFIVIMRQQTSFGNIAGEMFGGCLAICVVVLIIFLSVTLVKNWIK